MECNILVGGQAGQGLASIEKELTDLLFRLNYFFFATKFYMSRIRGGHNDHLFRVAERPVHALSGESWDVLVALDEETERRFKKDLSDGGICLSLEKIREIENRAKEELSNAAMGNSLLVGLLLRLLGVKPEGLSAVVREEDKPAALLAGMSLAERWEMADRFLLQPQAGGSFKFDGNSALGFGSLLGGCQFVAAYPMTPATSLMLYLAKAALELPVHFEQAEDEIAAINMALGASYAGLRSMVATSGGGFALMTEGVSLAGMTETPLVIVVAQRPGPSTGLPTRTEQGDLNCVLSAGQGEFPRLIYAPGSLEEAIDLGRRSFEMADRYQIPVFILTDQYLADSIQLLEDRPGLTVSSRPYEVFDASYRRYALTPDGLSPLTYPGLGEALVRVDSDEHTEEGRITEDLELRVRMMDKRLRKGLLLEEEAIPPTLFGKRDAGVYLICWGSNREIVAEVIARLSAEGISVAALHFSQVYPLTPAMVAGFPLAGKRLIIVENNATGQFAGLLRRELSLETDDSVLKYNGLCFSVKELCEEIRAKIISTGGGNDGPQ
ncbi:MAG: 2-oxoglutarate oxidoreductase subunit KorA [Syntrophus sp. PtaU1.Bin208]|nr:MAG: 2-oxoglutarate oxidoreductase subunit KorA [Syntrophus sp. PtaU1.Bin208]